LDFSEALKVIKAGQCVARAGWNGKGLFVFLVPGSTFTVNRVPLLGIYPAGTPITYRGHIDIKSADGSIVPWFASQTEACWPRIGTSSSAPLSKSSHWRVTFGDVARLVHFNPEVDREGVKRWYPEATAARPLEPGEFMRLAALLAASSSSPA
jgi:hypothetical protein